MLGRFLSRLRGLAGDRRGTVMVEFAVAFPVLLVLYLGSFTLSDAIACNRKVTMTARTVADLATRYPSLTHAEANTILSASAQVMYPYDASRAAIVLSEVQVINTTQARVVWSKQQNGTALVPGAILTIPTSMAAVNTYILIGTVQYTYNPPARYGGFFNSPMSLSDTVMMLPRVSSEVPLS